MKTVFVLLAGYHDGGIDHVDVIAVFTGKETAEKLIAYMKATEPSKTLRLVETPLEYVD